MNVQPSTHSTEPPIWSGWQNKILNGVYPLHQLLHGGQHSAVFLTDREGRPGTHATLKIVPMERVTLAQLAHWNAAKGLSHPHLIQLFDAGLCRLAGRQFLFVVMEYAQETLSGVLQQRALTPDEVRDLLPPTLRALTFLHRQGLVLGHLKPANVLVVDDQLKLASDGIRPAGAPRVSGIEPGVYDAPEATRAPFSPADDIWGLGVTAHEALTQRLPRIDEPSQIVRLPATVPAEFADMLQRCLSFDPTTRPAAALLQVESAGVAGVPEEQPSSAPEAVAPVAPAAPVATVATVAPREVTPTREHRGARGRVTSFVAGVFLIVLATVWADLRLFHREPGSPASPATPAQTAARAPAAISARAPQAQPVPAPPIAAPARLAAERKPTVLHAQLPDVARGALGTIHGRIKVSVLAEVDRSGVVIAAHLENRGPSEYFAVRAAAAARKWRFTPTDERGPREWLLRFEFARSGITGAATPRSR